MGVRAPSVTIALLIMLVIGFGTAALADEGGVPNSHAKTTAPGKSGATAPSAATGDGTGTATGGDATSPPADGTTTPATTTDLAPAAAPVLGKSAGVAPVSGEVNVKLPGRDGYVALSDA